LPEYANFKELLEAPGEDVKVIFFANINIQLIVEDRFPAR